MFLPAFCSLHFTPFSYQNSQMSLNNQYLLFWVAFPTPSGTISCFIFCVSSIYISLRPFGCIVPVSLQLSHFSHIRLFATPWTIARQAPLSMGFSRQEYGSGLPCPSPGNLPNLGIKPKSLMSPALAGRFFTISTTWEAHMMVETMSIYIPEVLSID